jgi:lysyl-tRNA synthetase class 2
MKKRGRRREVYAYLYDMASVSVACPSRRIEGRVASYDQRKRKSPDHMSEVEELAARRQMVTDLRAQGIDPYPSKVSRSHDAAAALAAFDASAPEEEIESKPLISVAGRMVTQRVQGKAGFAHVQDGSGRVQIYCRQDAVGEESYSLFKHLHPGDFIWAAGHMFRTRAGEITLKVTAIRLIAKALRPLPDKFHGISDIEVRYRKRYLDMIANRESFDRLVTRAKLTSILRRLLESKGFLEVETPVLQSLYGGAHARPFVTHFNALGEDLYLRIALELYHKRLLIGGVDKLFEIGRVFRNEGLSRKHNPEFTMLELYWAYADYHDIMDLVEWFVSEAAIALYGSPVLQVGDRPVDLTPPWPRVPLRDAILAESGINFAAFPAGMEVEFLAAARARGLSLPPGTPRGKIIDELLSTFVEPTLIDPVFLTDYPIELSPLAKIKADDPSLVERFEAFAGRVELANAFTELNDPEDQRRRFEAQALDRAAGDQDAHSFDEDFLEAMEHGMPPAGGLGVGIDRLAMLLTGADSIKDVLFFPHMRRGTEAAEAETDDE